MEDLDEVLNRDMEGEINWLVSNVNNIETRVSIIESNHLTHIEKDIQLIKKYGMMAKDFVKSMMTIGSMQTLRTSKYDAKGKFGRILGEFIVYDSKEDCQKSLKDIMIRECLGVEYLGQSKEDIEEANLVNRKQLEILSWQHHRKKV